MIFDSPLSFSEMVKELQAAGKLPTRLTASQMKALQASLGKFAATAGQRIMTEVFEGYRKTLLDLVNPQQKMGTEGTRSLPVTEGLNPATAREALTKLVTSKGLLDLVPRIDFAVSVGTAVANGAGRFVQQNSDPEAVDAFPALELQRLFERDVPRGFRRGKDGSLVPVPDDDWPSRWEAAAEESGDEDAAAVLEKTGRMVALKSSGVWQALGDGAGGYDDTLGNAYDPLAWNTGYRQVEVERAEAEELGLLQEGEAAEPAAIDFGKLFAISE